MTKPISPAAQAVLDAFLNGYICKPGCNVAFEADRNGIAAALRALDKQLGYDVLGVRAVFSSQIRLIAAELEGGND